MQFDFFSQNTVLYHDESHQLHTSETKGDQDLGYGYPSSNVRSFVPSSSSVRSEVRNREYQFGMYQVMRLAMSLGYVKIKS